MTVVGGQGTVFGVHPFGGGREEARLVTGSRGGGPGLFAGGHSPLGIIGVLSFLFIIPGIVLPSVTQIFVDEVLTKRLTGWIFWLVLGLVLAAVLNGVLYGMQEFFLRRIESRVAIMTGSRLFWRFLTLPLLYYAKGTVGDAAARLNAATRLAALLANRMGRSFTNLVLAIVFAGMLLLYSVVLASTCIGLTLVSVVIAASVGRRRAKLNAAQLRQLGEVASIGMLGLQAIETLKAMGTETFFFRDWAEANTRVINSQQHIDAMSISLDLAPHALAAVVTAISLGFGAVLVIQGHMTIGALLAFQMLLTRFSRPVGDLVSATQDAQEVMAQLRRVNETLALAPDPVAGPRADDSAPPGKLSGLLEMRQVSFAFGPDLPPLIEGLDLTVRPGARIAVVGGSGTGKSTIARLALGLYQPGAGTIRFDGMAIEDIPRPTWAASVGYVAQDVAMFNGTIRQNISMWDPTMPEQEVREAARDACIDDAILSLPSAYDSLITNGGTNFSGGERQRMEIARALSRKPSFLVLDEATAALDPTTEEQIDDNLRRRGCACLIIAHRPGPTIRDCDEIILVDGGKVVERGTHDQLVAAAARYAALAAGQ